MTPKHFLSNLPTRLYDLSARSLDPVSGQKSAMYRTKGTSVKFTEKHRLSDFQKSIERHLREQGLDTISYLQDPHDSTKVLSVVTHHAQFGNDLASAEVLSSQFK